MPRRPKKAHERPTEEAIRKLFPKPVRDAAKREAEKARKSVEKKNTKKDSTE